MKTPDKGECWGILGGTFDPIHVGHLRLATDILKDKSLDGIVLIPSFLHPFKKEKTSASYNQRLVMTELAVSSLESFYVSTIEKDENLSGYTLDTIKAIKNKFNNVQFYFLIGADNVEQLPSWHFASEILKEIKFLAGKRPYFDMSKIENDFSHAIEYIETSEIDISSTEIKKMLYKKEFNELKTILHPDVLKYIKESKLYRI